MKHIPNILSVIRILLVPVFVILFFSGTENAHLYAAIVYFTASATDVLDGMIARRFNAISNLGRILDPLGDKLMSLAMLTCLAISSMLPFKVMFFFLLKDALMIAGGVFIHQKLHTDMPSSNFFGKASTAMLFLVAMLMLLTDVPVPVINVMLLIATVVAFIALISYILIFCSVLKSSNNDSGTTGE